MDDCLLHHPVSFTKRNRNPDITAWHLTSPQTKLLFKHHPPLHLCRYCSSLAPFSQSYRRLFSIAPHYLPESLSMYAINYCSCVYAVIHLISLFHFGSYFGKWPVQASTKNSRYQALTSSSLVRSLQSVFVLHHSYLLWPVVTQPPSCFVYSFHLSLCCSVFSFLHNAVYPVCLVLPGAPFCLLSFFPYLFWASISLILHRLSSLFLSFSPLSFSNFLCWSSSGTSFCVPIHSLLFLGRRFLSSATFAQILLAGSDFSLFWCLCCSHLVSGGCWIYSSVQGNCLNSGTVSLLSSYLSVPSCFFPVLFNLSLTLVMMRLWLHPTSTPRCALVTWTDLLNWDLTATWSIWFRCWPSGNPCILNNYPAKSRGISPDT